MNMFKRLHAYNYRNMCDIAFEPRGKPLKSN